MSKNLKTITVGDNVYSVPVTDAEEVLATHDSSSIAHSDIRESVTNLETTAVFTSEDNENVETEIADGVNASEVSYSNATSGLTATSVQTAVDELSQEIDNVNENIGNLTAKDAELEESIDDINSTLDDKIGKNEVANLNSVILNNSEYAYVYSGDDNVWFRYKKPDGEPGYVNIGQLHSSMLENEFKYENFTVDVLGTIGIYKNGNCVYMTKYSAPSTQILIDTMYELTLPESIVPRLSVSGVVLIRIAGTTTIAAMLYSIFTDGKMQISVHQTGTTFTAIDTHNSFVFTLSYPM